MPGSFGNRFQMPHVVVPEARCYFSFLSASVNSKLSGSNLYKVRSGNARCNVATSDVLDGKRQTRTSPVRSGGLMI